jgi:hypothetical protein
MLMLVNSSSAQSPNTFLTHVDKVNGFSIMYPSNWEVNALEENKGVEFHGPEPDRGAFRVEVQDATPYLDTNTMALKNTTAEQYAQARLNTVSVMGQPDPNIIYKKIRSNEFPVGGNTGWKIEYIWGYLAEVYWFEIFTVANEKLFTLKYDALPLKVPKTLPLADKMVNSFNITYPAVEKLVTTDKAIGGTNDSSRCASGYHRSPAGGCERIG